MFEEAILTEVMRQTPFIQKSVYKVFIFCNILKHIMIILKAFMYKGTNTKFSVFNVNSKKLSLWQMPKILKIKKFTFKL